MSRVAEEPIDVKTLGISGVTFQDILKRITECYVYVSGRIKPADFGS